MLDLRNPVAQIPEMVFVSNFLPGIHVLAAAMCLLTALSLIFVSLESIYTHVNTQSLPFCSELTSSLCIFIVIVRLVKVDKHHGCGKRGKSETFPFLFVCLTIGLILV